MGWQGVLVPDFIRMFSGGGELGIMGLKRDKAGEAARSQGILCRLDEEYSARAGKIQEKFMKTSRQPFKWASDQII